MAKTQRIDAVGPRSAMPDGWNGIAMFARHGTAGIGTNSRVNSHHMAGPRLLARGGRMAAIVPDPKHPLVWMAYVAFSRIHGGRRVRYFNAAPDTGMLAALARYAEEGKVRPFVEGVYRLADIADAHRAFEAGGNRGRQIISLA